ncbi:hypothetical protein ACDF64_10485 [Agromyces sp. MMS24-JH15]|uniref:hypothetical protein n=1 Tax=Agromyces sp. MMS24-JH15 TaxID=3243765 RepID=UPI0037486594
MAHTHPLLDPLHEATHRVPGVPDHTERGSGHQGTARHGRAAQAPHSARRTHGRAPHQPQVRTPRVLVGWQRRIAALFGRDA